MERDADLKQGEKGAWLSIGAYLILSALKLVVGYRFHSEALIADGFNNSTDIAASIAVWIGLRISAKPADRHHRYGHYRAETVAALIASLIMAAVGLQVLIQSFGRLFEDEIPKPDGIAAWTAVFSAGVMLLVYRYNIRLAKRIRSKALMAAAMDNRSDAFVSIGAFVGIVGSRWGWAILDPVAALIVGSIICHTALKIFKEAAHALIDGFDDKELKLYKKTIESIAGVRKVKDIRARNHGNHVLLDVTVNVNPHLNIVQGHEITEEIEERMLRSHRVGHVHIHIEPDV